MQPLASLSPNFTAQPVSGIPFAPDSPIGSLYAASATNSAHAEGGSALAAICSLVEDLRASHGGRLDTSQFIRRMIAVTNFADAVFAAIPEVEAVVIYGSALRGKADAADLDARLVTCYMAQNDIDLENPVMNQIENKVDAAFRASTSIPRTVDGLPVQVFINSTFEDRTGLALEFTQKGPYLAILRPPQPSTTFRPNFPMFANTAGQGYLEQRAA